MLTPVTSNSTQHIGEVSASGSSQVVAGTVHGDVVFGNAEDLKGCYFDQLLCASHLPKA